MTGPSQMNELKAMGEKLNDVADNDNHDLRMMIW